MKPTATFGGAYLVTHNAAVNNGSPDFLAHCLGDLTFNSSSAGFPASNDLVGAGRVMGLFSSAATPGGTYTRRMPIDSAELTARLERADKTRLALRRTTLDLRALGAQLKEELARRHVAGSRRPDRGCPGDLPDVLHPAD